MSILGVDLLEKESSFQKKFNHKIDTKCDVVFRLYYKFPGIMYTAAFVLLAVWRHYSLQGAIVLTTSNDLTSQVNNKLSSSYLCQKILAIISYVLEKIHPSLQRLINYV